MSRLRKYSNVLLLNGAAATKNLFPHLFKPKAVLTFSKTSLLAILKDNESATVPDGKKRKISTGCIVGPHQREGINTSPNSKFVPIYAYLPLGAYFVQSEFYFS